MQSKEQAHFIIYDKKLHVINDHKHHIRIRMDFIRNAKYTTHVKRYTDINLSMSTLKGKILSRSAVSRLILIE